MEERDETISFRTTKDHKTKWQRLIQREQKASAQPISQVQAIERVIDKLTQRQVN